MANSFFAYEFSIPLGESSARFYGLGTKTGQKISIGLIWGEIDKGKMGGRGGKGGPPGGGPGGKSGVPEKQEIWLKAQLSLPESAPDK